MRKLFPFCVSLIVVLIATGLASAQSFMVQCPTSTITHPSALHDNNSEPAYTAATTLSPGSNGYLVPTANVNGAIKCQQISGGDGFATMGDGTQTYLFAFGPLSGLSDMANGLPGTEFPNTFNAGIPGTLMPGDPATTDGVVADSWPSSFPGTPLSTSAFPYNGAVGLNSAVSTLVSIFDISEVGNVVTVVTSAPPHFNVGDTVIISGNDTAVGYNGTFVVTGVNIPNAFYPPNFAFTYNNPVTGLADINEPASATASSPASSDGHVDVRPIMDVGVLNGNMPAPLMAIDEDDEFFLTLTNVGQVMRPDLFEQHTVHFHGYPNASAFYDGVPDASVAINIGGSFTYYYLAPEAGTYFWHCHITPPEHLQMGMVGQIYVRPRQDRVPENSGLRAALVAQQSDNRTKCDSSDILCSNPLPPANSVNRAATGTLCSGAAATGKKPQYAYNDGDGTTCYDAEYPLQIHGFDPNFHFVGMTFNPEAFTDMKDKYFLLNGRSYPDTVTPGPLATQTTDGSMHFSQPLPSIINIPRGGKALLRISDLDVTEYQTLASLGIPMQVIALNAKLLRDQAGNNLYYKTNSITLAGGESLDVILDASDTAKYPSGSVFYLYTPNLDHLSNDAENFGGLMTEVRIN
jgi:FtsP/CotA-like multicopper oxidase with cupredoxin domain